MNKVLLIIPDTFAAASNHQKVRQNITQEFTVSVVSLSQKTFQPHTNSKSSLIYLSFPKKNNFFNYCANYEKLEWKSVSYEELEKNNWIFRNLDENKGKIRLGDILEQVIPPKIIIDPNQKYYELTVRTNGRGVERRIRNKCDFIFGSQIKSNRYFVPAHCLIVSKIDARNGAIGVIPKNLGNSLITDTFWLFNLKKDYQEISADYLTYCLTSSDYQTYFESLSCGTTNRRSLNIKDFLNTKIEIEKFDKFLVKYQKKTTLEQELSLLNQEIKEMFLERNE